MEVKNPIEQKIEFSPEQFVKNIYNRIIPESKESIFTNKEYSKLFFYTCLILIINIVLVTKRWTTEKENKVYIKYYNGLYHDFLKYLIIESALTISSVVENNKFNIINSLSRIAIVLIGLLIFHSIKNKIGINNY